MPTSGQRPTFRIPVSNGILEHCPQMGDSVWLLLWAIDHTTKENDGKGKVLGGMPIKDARIAGDLGVGEKTVRRWRRRLLQTGDIEAKNTGHGHCYTVLRSKKWSEARVQSGQKRPVSPDEDVQPELPKPADLVDPNRPTRVAGTGNSDRPEAATLYRQSRDRAETVHKPLPLPLVKAATALPMMKS
jgi:hypothetical protein